MAAYDLLFADPGGEYYFSLGPSAAGVWTAGTVNTLLVSNATVGRATQYALNGTGNFGVNFSNRQSWCVGWAFYSTGMSGVVLLQFFDASSSQVELRLNSSGQLFFTRNGTAIGGTYSGFVINTWNYFEVKAFIATGTSGSVELRINGAVVLTVTGVSTSTSGNAYANQVKWGGIPSVTNYWKDMYIMADTGSGPFTTYLGDITVAVLYPNAAGVNQAWTLGAGSSQTAAVQDGINHTGTWPDGDTSYIDSATAGQISDFAHQSLSLTGTILSVLMVGYMRKDDAGSRSAANVCLSTGTESDGATQSLGNTYAYYFDVLDKDPHTSAAWTLSGLNAATFGVKEIS